MNLKNAAILERRNLEKTIAKITTMLEGLPEGQIRFHKNGKGYKRRLLKEDPLTKVRSFSYILKSAKDLAQNLCIKEYLTSRLNIYKRRLAIVEEIIVNCEEEASITKNYCSEFNALLQPFLMRGYAAEKWASEPYDKSTDHPEHLTVPTRSGHIVRSKSEGYIADALFNKHIAFRYEQLLRIGENVYAPDFTIRHPVTKKIYIWEHFGRMEKQAYIRSNLYRIEAYQGVGYIAGKNFIMTFESDDCPLDANYVDYLVDYYFG